MILHTIVPGELIFQSAEVSEESSEQMFMYAGIPVAAQPLNNEVWQVTKIMSTDPNHFLNADIYPGATLRMW